VHREITTLSGEKKVILREAPRTGSRLAGSPVSFRLVLYRHGAPAQPVQISTPWRRSSVSEYSGMRAAQQMRRCGLTIASLPLDSNARI